MRQSPSADLAHLPKGGATAVAALPDHGGFASVLCTGVPINWDTPGFRADHCGDPLDIPVWQADLNLPRFVKKMRDLGNLSAPDTVT